MRVLKKDGTPWEIIDDDILQFKSHNSTLYAVTEEGEFIYPTSISDILTAHFDIGYESLDRSNVVNTKQVASFDPVRKIVLFKGCTDIFAVVSKPNESRIQKIIELQKEGFNP